jgi:hypothetical protein
VTRDIKKFAKELEKRTKQFAIDIIRLSSSLPNTAEGRTVRTQLTKAGTYLLGPITVKLTGPEAKRILGTRLLFAKVRLVKLNTG